MFRQICRAWIGPLRSRRVRRGALDYFRGNERIRKIGPLYPLPWDPGKRKERGQILRCCLVDTIVFRCQAAAQRAESATTLQAKSKRYAKMSGLATQRSHLRGRLGQGSGEGAYLY